jgi:polar amino acid transport system substrate-binding protein
MKLFKILLLILVALPALAEDKVIILAGDAWCPWNCEEQDKDQGFAIDVAKAVFEPLGYKIIYKVLPWNRAIQEAIDGHVTAVVVSAKADKKTKDFVFPEEYIRYSTNGFVLPLNSNFKYAGTADSLKNIRIGVVDGYGFEGSIGEYIKANYEDQSKIQRIAGVDTAKLNLQKLAAGRIDTYIDDIDIIKLYNQKK